jgi:carbon monoxide dehydrogenase subunit G
MTIQISATIKIASHIDSVWEFFNDINTVAGCMPTVIRYEIADDGVVHCDLRIKLGLIPLDSTARMQITDREVNRRLVVEGETRPGAEMLKRFGKLSNELLTKLHITVDLEALSIVETQICFTLQAEAMGQLHRIYNSIIKSQRDKLLNQLIENIEKAFGTRAVIDEKASEGLKQSLSAEDSAAKCS